MPRPLRTASRQPGPPFPWRPGRDAPLGWTLVDYGLTTLIADAEGNCVAEFADRADAELVLAAIRLAARAPQAGA